MVLTRSRSRNSSYSYSSSSNNSSPVVMENYRKSFPGSVAAAAASSDPVSAISILSSSIATTQHQNPPAAAEIFDVHGVRSVDATDAMEDSKSSSEEKDTEENQEEEKEEASDFPPHCEGVPAIGTSLKRQLSFERPRSDHVKTAFESIGTIRVSPLVPLSIDAHEDENDVRPVDESLENGLLSVERCDQSHCQRLEISPIPFAAASSSISSSSLHHNYSSYTPNVQWPLLPLSGESDSIVGEILAQETAPKVDSYMDDYNNNEQHVRSSSEASQTDDSGNEREEAPIPMERLAEDVGASSMEFIRRIRAAAFRRKLDVSTRSRDSFAAATANAIHVKDKDNEPLKEQRPEPFFETVAHSHSSLSDRRISEPHSCAFSPPFSSNTGAGAGATTTGTAAATTAPRCFRARPAPRTTGAMGSGGLFGVPKVVKKPCTIPLSPLLGSRRAWSSAFAHSRLKRPAHTDAVPAQTTADSDDMESPRRNRNHEDDDSEDDSDGSMNRFRSTIRRDQNIFRSRSTKPQPTTALKTMITTQTANQAKTLMKNRGVAPGMVGVPTVPKRPPTIPLSPLLGFRRLKTSSDASSTTANNNTAKIVQLPKSPVNQRSPPHLQSSRQGLRRLHTSNHQHHRSNHHDDASATAPDVAAPSTPTSGSLTHSAVRRSTRTIAQKNIASGSRRSGWTPTSTATSSTSGTPLIGLHLVDSTGDLASVASAAAAAAASANTNATAAATTATATHANAATSATLSFSGTLTTTPLPCISSSAAATAAAAATASTTSAQAIPLPSTTPTSTIPRVFTLHSTVRAAQRAHYDALSRARQCERIHQESHRRRHSISQLRRELRKTITTTASSSATTTTLS